MLAASAATALGWQVYLGARLARDPFVRAPEGAPWAAVLGLAGTVLGGILLLPSFRRAGGKGGRDWALGAVLLALCVESLVLFQTGRILAPPMVPPIPFLVALAALAMLL